MRVLVACECSQTVCKEFRALGHEAYSCDIEKEYGGHPSGKARCWEEMVKGDRATVRSKTFPGIAKAMAEQWG